MSKSKGSPLIKRVCCWLTPHVFFKAWMKSDTLHGLTHTCPCLAPPCPLPGCSPYQRKSAHPDPPTCKAASYSTYLVRLLQPSATETFLLAGFDLFRQSSTTFSLRFPAGGSRGVPPVHSAGNLVLPWVSSIVLCSTYIRPPFRQTKIKKYHVCTQNKQDVCRGLQGR